MIYPNPLNHLLTIKSDESDIHSIEIISLNGQLIYRTDMEGTTKQIEMTRFKKGVYFITVRSKGYVSMENVLKM